MNKRLSGRFFVANGYLVINNQFKKGAPTFGLGANLFVITEFHFDSTALEEKLSLCRRSIQFAVF